MSCNPIRTIWRVLSDRFHARPPDHHQKNVEYDDAEPHFTQYNARPADTGQTTGPAASSQPRRTTETTYRLPLLRDDSTLPPVAEDDGPSALRKLQEGLKKCRQASRPARPQVFVSRTDLQRLVNEDLEEVLEEIRNKSAVKFENIPSYCRLISQSAVRLFAILVDIRMEQHIIQFLNEGVHDENLPLVRAPKHGPSCSALFTKQKACISALESWHSEAIIAFEAKQYRMLSPVFRRGEHYKLDQLHILPYTDQDNELEYKPVAAGGFGEVSRECIHPDHHEFEPSAQGLTVAVKQMFHHDDFEPERKVYRDLGHSSHPHLIDLLFTYQKHDKYHFVFPWADGSLMDYWERYPKPKRSPQLLLWSLEQMVGIADGLAYFHQFINPVTGTPRFGRHGDIKAKNILWFRKENVLKIADLGLASVRGKGSRSNVHPSTVLVSPTYSPPEVERKHSISRKWDIWSLGCLYLEFISYLVLGCEAIAEFSRNRSANGEFPELFTDAFYSANFETVKPSVGAWVNYLKSKPRCSRMMCDILELVMRQMIVIDPNARSTSREIHKALNMILKNAKQSKNYLLKSDPAARASPGTRPRAPRLNNTDPQSGGIQQFGSLGKSSTWNI